MASDARGKKKNNYHFADRVAFLNANIYIMVHIFMHMCKNVSDMRENSATKCRSSHQITCFHFTKIPSYV